MPDIVHISISALALITLVAVEMLRAATGTTRAVRRLQWVAWLLVVGFAAVVADRLAEYV